MSYQTVAMPAAPQAKRGWVRAIVVGAVALCLGGAIGSQAAGTKTITQTVPGPTVTKTVTTNTVPPAVRQMDNEATSAYNNLLEALKAYSKGDYIVATIKIGRAKAAVAAWTRAENRVWP